MSYNADGSGHLTLRQSAREVEALKMRKRERYEAQCADALSLADG